ncbi:MAG TPA: NADH-quinone oxidoreductase subunit N, partial [Cellulomonas sp.]
AWPLALVGVLASAAAAFFYVRLIVLMFFTAPQGGPDDGTVVGTDGGRPRTVVVTSEGFAVVAIGLCALITVALGVFPGPVLELIGNATQFLP